MSKDPLNEIVEYVDMQVEDILELIIEEHDRVRVLAQLCHYYEKKISIISAMTGHSDPSKACEMIRLECSAG